MGKDGATNRVHIRQSNAKSTPIKLLPPNPETRNKTPQEGNGALTVLTEVMDNSTVTMAITVVSDTILVYPERNPP